jgi:hypothetical protein
VADIPALPVVPLPVQTVSQFVRRAPIVARAFDMTDESDRAFARLAVAIAKYWLGMRAVPVAAACLECHELERGLDLQELGLMVQPGV